MASRLALATTFAMFALIVVGSVVRSTGSGLACPDWPLCEGRVIPRFELHVLLEWSHRMLALLVSLMLFATVFWVAVERPLRARLGALAMLAVVLLFTQVLLGALTVWRLLSPAVVSSHLATGLLLFSTLLTLGLVARREALVSAPTAPVPAGWTAGFGAATLVIFVQAVLGGVVSTNYAGTVCPDWPTCRGEWFPPLEGLVAVHMAHRWVAYALAGLLFTLMLRARRTGHAAVARPATLLVALVVTQMAIGIVNVLLGVRVWLSALHLATAAAMLAVSVTATVRVAGHEARRPAPVAAAAT